LKTQAIEQLTPPPTPLEELSFTELLEKGSKKIRRPHRRCRELATAGLREESRTVMESYLPIPQT
jgi:hypothetical protein